MRLIQLALAFVIIGLFIFYAMADFDVRNWQYVYGTWDKVKDLLFILYIYINIKKIRTISLPVLIVLSARLLWEIISWVFNISINEEQWINYLFILVTGTCFVFLLKEQFRLWKQN